jgi:hypothetical protein
LKNDTPNDRHVMIGPENRIETRSLHVRLGSAAGLRLQQPPTLEALG